MSAEPNLLAQIIHDRALTVLFQPIVLFSKRDIFGFEGLIRGPSDTHLHSPLNLFDAAGRTSALADLQGLCQELIIQRYQQLRLPGKLFLNVNPCVILEPGPNYCGLIELLSQNEIPTSQVVIELTEQQPITDYALMREATEYYRTTGFAIAIDDLGAGYSGLRSWSELRPDYVKVDRHFIQNIHEDSTKCQFVRSILEITQNLNCRVIAEGIETAQEYTVVKEMGIELGQGYYFGRPHIQPVISVPLLRPLWSLNLFRATPPAVRKQSPIC
ncbi:EAL domain-containing protein [Nitrosococcus wardiae]|nr:EAL domain-containing protein [Nitrosococcus wardiae]